MKLVLTLSFLVLTAGCAQQDSIPTTTTTEVVNDTLAPTCSPVGDGTLTTFNADGSFRITSKGALQNGALAVNLCDGNVPRIVFVEGLRAGEEKNHQAGVFIDATGNVVNHNHLVTTSTSGITPEGLVGVTVQCSPIGDCNEVPVPEKPAEVPTPTAPPAAEPVTAGS